MKRPVLILLLFGFLFAQSPAEVEITAEPSHHLILQNDQVRVFYVDVPPGAETLTHWHRHDYIFVTLGPTEIVNAVKGKDPITQKLADGDTRLVPGNFAHHVHDTGLTDFRNVTIEILQDEKLRQSSLGQSTTSWDEDRALDILEGGTKQILWIKDGIRATEYELQPAATAPVPISDAPYLLVAITDLELLQTDPNASVGASDRIHLKPGEVRWIPSPHRHGLTHRGPAVKFITLEFPRGK
jgi:quercetin dioxygenase-like cupin family protein